MKQSLVMRLTFLNIFSSPLLEIEKKIPSLVELFDAPSHSTPNTYTTEKIISKVMKKRANADSLILLTAVKLKTIGAVTH